MRESRFCITFCITVCITISYNVRPDLCATDCSDGPLRIASEVFTVHVLDVHGVAQATRWRISAVPVRRQRKRAPTTNPALAFNLECLSHPGLTGHYRFTTLRRTWFGGMRAVSTFDPVPLDAANKYTTYIGYHPNADLTIKVSISVVVPNNLNLTPAQSQGGYSITSSPPPYVQESSSSYVEPISYSSPIPF